MRDSNSVAGELSIKLHLHTLDTQIPHPDAEQTVLQYSNESVPISFMGYHVLINIIGSSLACLYKTIDDGMHQAILILWDWRSGKVLGV